jgi:hypothetical protein
MTQWREFSTPDSIGQFGSEGGTIIADERHDKGARITLERSTRSAPFAITCGVSGWMVHTRFFDSEIETRSQYDVMKAALARMIDATDSSQIGRLCQEFIERFP